MGGACVKLGSEELKLPSGPITKLPFGGGGLEAQARLGFELWVEGRVQSWSLWVGGQALSADVKPTDRFITIDAS